MNKYYLVSESILPEVIDKVIQAQTLLSTGKVRKISEAVRIAGISRGTFYKYKDQVFIQPDKDTTRKAVVDLIVQDRKGLLSLILTRIANMNCSVLAINQTIPIHEVSNVVVTLDISELPCEVEDLIALLKGLDGVDKAELVAVE